jgi:hypothetical protein
MPPQSAAALAGVLLSKSLVPAPFLECVPSLKLILVFPTNEHGVRFRLLSQIPIAWYVDDKGSPRMGTLGEPYWAKQISGNQVCDRRHP